jgi:dihydroxyacetone kinase-like predicted kinase
MVGVERRFLNEARGNVGIALSNLMHGQPTLEKIEKAKGAVEEWIKQLRSDG